MDHGDHSKHGKVSYKQPEGVETRLEKSGSSRGPAHTCEWFLSVGLRLAFCVFV